MALRIRMGQYLPEENDYPLEAQVKTLGDDELIDPASPHAAERQALTQAVHIRADRCGGLFRGHLFCQLRRGVLKVQEPAE